MISILEFCVGVGRMSGFGWGCCCYGFSCGCVSGLGECVFGWF